MGKLNSSRDLRQEQKPKAPHPEAHRESQRCPKFEMYELGSQVRRSSNALLFQRACRVIPGGVNSPVRAFGAVGGEPVFMERGQGSRLFDADGREFIDFCGSWGPLLLGHGHPAVIEAIQRAAADGTSFGTCTEREVELAELLRDRAPYLERVRLVNSGTEAGMTAIRLARGFTNRKKILKFDGCYHGHADSLLVSAGSGLLTAGIASSAGVPEGAAADTVVAPYNDLQAVESLMGRHGGEIAAIIVEPVAGNMGLVPPAAGFLEGLRRLTSDQGALLIFDEVITGFRLGPTTYGALHDITPDLTCLGKIVGGGMPLGAVGGSARIMDKLAPLGPVYQGGTLSGNPVAVAAGLTTLKLLIEQPPYSMVESLGRLLATGLPPAGKGKARKHHGVFLGGMFTIFFRDRPVMDLAGAKLCDTLAYAGFFNAMLQRGIYLPPSQFEVCFISAAHTTDDMRLFMRALSEVLGEDPGNDCS